MWPFTPASSVIDPPERGNARIGTDSNRGVPEPPEGGLLGWMRRITGWPGAAEASRQTALQVKLESEEFRVNSGPSGITLPWLSPYMDEYTAETAAIRACYRKMLSDPNVAAAFDNVWLAVACQTLKIVPANRGKKPLDREVCDFVRWNLTERLAGGVPELVRSTIGHGMIDGYSLCLKEFEAEDSGRFRGKWPLAHLTPQDVEANLALETDPQRNVVRIKGMRYNAGKHYSPSRFVHYRHKPLYNSPVGTSAFRAAYSSWWIRDTVTKLRAINAERRAVPFLLGTYQTTSQKPGLEQALQNVKSLAWASLPEGVKIEVTSIAGAADDIFQGFIKDCEHKIFLAIQGAMLQSLEGSVTDGRGNSQVHALTADLRALYLARCVCNILNGRDGLIRDIVDLNYVVEEYPTATLSHPNYGEMLQDLDIAERLHGLGLSLSKERLYERFGVEAPDLGQPDDVLVGSTPPPPMMDPVFGLEQFTESRYQAGRRRRVREGVA
jgi:hypothetical protein